MRPWAARRMAQLAGDPRARLRWHVLKTFGVLPTERRARRLDDRTVVDLALHMILDAGGTTDAAGENPAFDEARFEELKRHGKVANG